jgi:hypothetical protein
MEKVQFPVREVSCERPACISDRYAHSLIISLLRHARHAKRYGGRHGRNGGYEWNGSRREYDARDGWQLWRSNDAGRIWSPEELVRKTVIGSVLRNLCSPCLANLSACLFYIIPLPRQMFDLDISSGRQMYREGEYRYEENLLAIEWVSVYWLEIL